MSQQQQTVNQMSRFVSLKTRVADTTETQRQPFHASIGEATPWPLARRRWRVAPPMHARAYEGAGLRGSRALTIGQPCTQARSSCRQ